MQAVTSIGDGGLSVEAESDTAARGALSNE
jgi:hypothetical protein